MRKKTTTKTKTRKRQLPPLQQQFNQLRKDMHDQLVQLGLRIERALERLDPKPAAPQKDPAGGLVR